MGSEIPEPATKQGSHGVRRISQHQATRTIPHFQTPDGHHAHRIQGRQLAEIDDVVAPASKANGRRADGLNVHLSSRVTVDVSSAPARLKTPSLSTMTMRISRATLFLALPLHLSQ
jgi:hypothetical protein